MITVLVSASPIPSMPSIDVIDETLDSVRQHLPAATVIVLCDGVRDADEDLTDAYRQWRDTLAEAYASDPHLTIVRHETWVHQAAMYRAALEYVTTPLVLMMEADTPLTSPEVGPIPWDDLCDVLDADLLDSVRFSHEASILSVHEHLALDREPIEIGGVPVVRTVQFSARPHLARADWYRRILADHFPTKSRTYTEDVLHGVVQHAWYDDGMFGWERYRLAIYAPDGSMVRSRHTDGRAGRVKAPVVM